MQIKPLPSTPTFASAVDRTVRDAITEGNIRFNQLLKKTATVAAHKDQHKTGGTDALTAADIGAASTTHKSTHATGGTDALAPADIGAAAATHTHSGSVVQVQHYQTGAMATGTAAIPFDDTIPQNNEGVEVMTLSITPKSASNILLIDVCVFVTASAADWVITALFKDSGADALAFWGAVAGNGTWSAPTHFRHKMTAGTTSATTFKVRCGPSLTNTITVNGVSGARKGGGTLATSITVTEIAA